MQAKSGVSKPNFAVALVIVAVALCGVQRAAQLGVQWWGGEWKWGYPYNSGVWGFSPQENFDILDLKWCVFQ